MARLQPEFPMKPELKVLKPEDAPKPPQDEKQSPAQGEMPFAVVDGEPVTTLPQPFDLMTPEHLGLDGDVYAGPEIHYHYDTLGNLESQSDPRDAGYVTEYEYNELHWQVEVTQPATAGQHGSPVTKWSYYKDGRVQAVDRRGPQDGDPHPSCNCRFAVENDDGTTDVYFGPEAPAGKESNWIQTLPDKGYFVILRLYSPLQPFFDKTWRPGEIKLVK